jgi:hypothetical protein
MKLSVRYKVGSKVKHLPSGNIVKIESMTKVFFRGKIIDPKYPDHFSYETTKVRIDECEPYIEPPKEKSPYDIMRERNMEDAKKLAPTPDDIGQHILWLKMAVIDRVEKIENKTGKEIYTFRKGNSSDDNSKFGFSEHYVNLLMHYAYEAGKNNATENLTRSFNESTNSMRNAINSIVNALDNNGLLPENDYEY